MKPWTPTWEPAGTVYGTLLNFQCEWDLWAPRMTQDPHKATPQAPVLYVKTANTFSPAGQDLLLQPGDLILAGTPNSHQAMIHLNEEHTHEYTPKPFQTSPAKPAAPDRPVDGPGQCLHRRNLRPGRV